MLVLVAAAAILVISAIVAADLLPLTEARLERSSAALIADFGPWAVLRDADLPVPNGGALGPAVIASTVVPFAAYSIAVLAVWGRVLTSRGVAWLTVAAIAMWAVVAFALPTYDTDVFNYIVSGRVGAVHGANPHLVPPTAFPDDPLLGLAGARYTPIPGDNKLPGWTLVNVALAGIAGNDPLANLFLYRGFFLALNVVNLGLVAVAVRRWQPRFVATGLVLYGWHPIVVAAGQSKVETLMVTLLLLAALAIAVGRPRLAIVGLVFSSLVKLTTLPLLALTILAEVWQRRWREAVVMGAIAFLVAAAAYLPFGDPRALLPAHAQLLGAGGSSFPEIVRPVLAVTFVIVILWLAAHQDGSASSLIRSWALVALFFAVFLTRIAFSWYLMPLIALVAIVPSWPLAAAMIAYTAASALFDAWFSFPLPPLLTIPTELAYSLPVLVVVAGILLIVLVRRMALRSR